MAETFADAWTRARLALPGVPPLLVRDWVQDAYTRLCEYRGGGWAFLRKEGSINTRARRTLSVTVTQGSTTVTSAALFSTITDPGRQFRVSTIPIYTIASVTDASTAVLDQPYADVSGTIAATILDLYFVCPSDFRRFIAIFDPYYLRVIPFWVSQDEIAVADPARVIGDLGPRYLVAQGMSTATATLGQVRYEYWPSPSNERHYPFLYYRQAERFSETSFLPGVIGNRSDLLKLGSLIEAAGWPGTTDQRNPYFNLPHQQTLLAQWERELERVSFADDNEFPEDLMAVHWTRRYGALAPTASLLRQTDATVNDYF